MQSLGNGTAFSAVAPSQRPVCDAINPKYSGGVSDHSPGPEYWRVNILPLGQFRPAPRLSVSPIHIA